MACIRVMQLPDVCFSYPGSQVIVSIIMYQCNYRHEGIDPISSAHQRLAALLAVPRQNNIINRSLLQF
jgi:hypothetical protein